MFVESDICQHARHYTVHWENVNSAWVELFDSISLATERIILTVNRNSIKLTNDKSMFSYILLLWNHNSETRFRNLLFDLILVLYGTLF